MSIVQALQQAGPFQVMERLGFDGVLATLRGADVNRGHSACIVAVAESDLEGEDAAWSSFQQSFNLLVATPRSRMLRPLQCGREPGVIWAAYEYAEGMHLGKAVRDMGLPTIGDALRLAAQTLQALHSLHGSRTTHRILSPASIFVRTSGEVTLHHCGWSSVVLAVRGGAANPSLMSILPFLAPEVVAGGEVGIAADMYSLGANLYFLITGQPVLWGDSPEEIVQAISDRAPDMAPVLGVCSPEVADLLEELLEKDPDDRPQNFDALLSRINSLADRIQAQEAAAPPPDTEKLSAVPGTGVSNEATVRLPPASGSGGQSLPPPPAPARNLPPIEQIPQKAAAPSAPAPPPPPPPGIDEQEEDEQPTPAASRAMPPPPVPVQHPSAARKAAKGGPKLGIIAAVVVLLVVVAGAAIFLMGGGDDEPSPGKNTVAKPAGPSDDPVETPAPAEKPSAKPAAKPGDPAAPAPKASAGDRAAATRAMLKTVGAAHKKYLVDNGLWAAEMAELKLPKDQTVDAWGTPLELRESYVVCAGPDRKWDTGDDMWVEAESGSAGP